MSLLSILFSLTAALYAAAGAFYLHSLYSKTSKERPARLLLELALLSHAFFLSLVLRVAGWAELLEIHGVLLMISFLSAGIFLFVCRRYNTSSLGAFVVPVIFAFFSAGGALHGPPDASSAESLVLPFHIAANVLGTVAFALAFAAALGYLLQESRLRHKRLTGLSQQLPALSVMESLSFRSVVIGFPLLTLGILSGTLFGIEGTGSRSLYSPTQLLGYLAWGCFAAVLLLRLLVGWRGRRAAIGTVVGFCCALLVLVGYLFRADS